MKQYLLRFGSTNPGNYLGLSPTFTVFQSIPGASWTPVGTSISQVGASIGLYTFGYTATTFPVAFIIDGGASMAASDRFISGILDPLQAVDEKVGTPADSFGTTGMDPTTVFGYVKRNQEMQEGTSAFNAVSGLWTVLSRAISNGASITPTTLFTHILSNISGSVTKS